MGGSFWERTAWSLINYWNMPIIIFNPFANFGKQSILQILSHILYVFTLYKWYSLTSFYFFRSTPQSLFLDLSSLALPSPCQRATRMLLRLYWWRVAQNYTKRLSKHDTHITWGRHTASLSSSSHSVTVSLKIHIPVSTVVWCPSASQCLQQYNDGIMTLKLLRSSALFPAHISVSSRSGHIRNAPQQSQRPCTRYTIKQPSK